jgi:hypothetical protein
LLALFGAHAVFKLRESALKSYFKKGEIFCDFSKASEYVNNEALVH